MIFPPRRSAFLPSIPPGRRPGMDKGKKILMILLILSEKYSCLLFFKMIEEKLETLLE